MKKALLLCASHNDLGLIRGLRKEGFFILAIGNAPGLPGEKYVDQYIQMDYSDKEQVLALAQSERIDAVCQCCNDLGVYTAAYVAEKMGLGGYDSYDTTLLLHNKDRFKRFAGEHGISIPEFFCFSDKSEAFAWLRRQQEYPWIVKPVDASAGNGVSVAGSLEEGRRAVEKAFANSREKRIIIEKYVQGSQHGFCTFLRRRRVAAIATNNEYSVLNPYRVEIDTFPASGWERVSGFLTDQVEKIAGILELKDGIFHLQYRMDGEIPRIIEVMRRVPGNMYSVPAGRLCGIDWDYWEVRAKCGLSCGEFPEDGEQTGFFAYKTLLAPANGVIRRITVPRRYERYLFDTFYVRSEGERIMDHTSQPVGFLFLQFPSQEEMHRVLVREYDNSGVQIDDPDSEK